MISPDLIFHCHNGKTQEIISYLRPEVISLFGVRNCLHPFPQQFNFFKISGIILSGHRRRIIPVMIGIIIWHYADSLRIYCSRKDHLQIFSHRHPVVPQVKILLHQFPPEQFSHPGWLNSSSDKASIIDQYREQFLPFFRTVIFLRQPVAFFSWRIIGIFVIKDQTCHGHIRLLCFQRLI